tara:strand:+ start:406 stop:531 length:126 start_codon:yes stop_codon:yes gene_type:complete
MQQVMNQIWVSENWDAIEFYSVEFFGFIAKSGNFAVNRYSP